MTPSPFIAPARAQTMLRDFEAHRKAVLSGDVANIDATWDRCERWVDQLRPDFTEQAEATQQRIKTLEEALGFYASNENWSDGKLISPGPNVLEMVNSSIDDDCGQKARAALRGEAG